MYQRREIAEVNRAQFRPVASKNLVLVSALEPANDGFLQPTVLHRLGNGGDGMVEFHVMSRPGSLVRRILAGGVGVLVVR